ncbi:MAG: hypothetical protein ABIR19_03345 [Ginsengibacter sp.]
MKNILSALFAVALFFPIKPLLAQDTLSVVTNDTLPDQQPVTAAPEKTSFKVAVFAPMYLDSVFINGALRTGNSVPRFIMPAVEFAQGAAIAFDTLRLNGKTAEAFIYDSRSYIRPISWLIANHLLDHIDLIIGSVKDPDYRELAYFSKQKNIPFVSATYPNDGGVTETPGMIIVNSTLKSHCEGIFSYLLQKHGTDKIYLVKKKGDERIENYLKEINVRDGKPLLNIKTIPIDSSISSYALWRRIDTTVATVIIGATLNEPLAKNITDASYSIQKKHPLTLIGMPNWDGFKIFGKKDAYTDFPILFTSPHYDGHANLFSDYLIDKYYQLYRARPSDMAYKGFELTYFFTNLLLHYPSNMMDHLNDPQFSVIHDFNFIPIFLDNKNSSVPDYYENKHLFIMHILNGEIDREW